MSNYSRVAASLSSDLEFLCSDVEDRLAPWCESPIELMLGTAIIAGWNMAGMFNSTQFVGIASSREPPDSALILHPQYSWESYRIDFAVRTPGGKIIVFIECDGHDFHERTKEQAERDRSKDRAIQAAGIPILRFTGREIFRDPSGCASQILSFIRKHIDRGGNGAHPND